MTTITTGGTQWADASGPGAGFTVSSVSTAPEPPVRGGSVTVTVSGTLTEGVSGGRTRTAVSYGIIAMADRTAALPAAEAGPYSATVAFDLPADGPTGSYVATVWFIDQNDAEIAAINITFTI
ncbi:ML domain-containing protein [Streptomyces sp. NPDC014894]|uniref:ML domain-containing protein n=1 Tax=Streptomyces sp. NPDC014894 TaxID=3364931 RepID=UPI0036FAA99D